MTLLVRMLEKSPLRNAGFGMVIGFVTPPSPGTTPESDRMRVPCQSANQNVLFLMMGPPTATPYWFCLRYGFVAPARFRSHVLAFSLSFWRNSNSVPWMSFVPDLMVTFT